MHDAGNDCRVVRSQTARRGCLQVREYAEYLGMDADAHPELLFIAKYAMDAELPTEWTAYIDAEGNEYFHNAVSGTSQYEHPLDAQYTALYESLCAKKKANGGLLSTVDLAQAHVLAPRESTSMADTGLA